MKVSELISILKGLESGPGANVWVQKDGTEEGYGLREVSGVNELGDEISTEGAYEGDVILTIPSIHKE